MSRYELQTSVTSLVYQLIKYTNEIKESHSNGIKSTIIDNLDSYSGLEKLLKLSYMENYLEGIKLTETLLRLDERTLGKIKEELWK
jgi:hypothetical protein